MTYTPEGLERKCWVYLFKVLQPYPQLSYWAKYTGQGETLSMSKKKEKKKIFLILKQCLK
jgi:hypothetical protein